MNRTDRVFTGRNRPAFIAFTVAGDPDPETSVRVAEALATAGADIIELGMPYSYPSADDPVIQKADLRALEAGTTPDTLFTIIRGIRRRSTVPIMILIVDLPAEEIGMARMAADRYGLCQIVMAAPTTTDERLGLVRSAGRRVPVRGLGGRRDRSPGSPCRRGREPARTDTEQDHPPAGRRVRNLAPRAYAG